MLVLTRGTEQAVVIGTGENQITVKVTEIRGGRIRIAIDAPRDVAISRGELLVGHDGAQAVAAAR